MTVVPYTSSIAELLSCSSWSYKKLPAVEQCRSCSRGPTPREAVTTSISVSRTVLVLSCSPSLSPGPADPNAHCCLVVDRGPCGMRSASGTSADVRSPGPPPVAMDCMRLRTTVCACNHSSSVQDGHQSGATDRITRKACWRCRLSILTRSKMWEPRSSWSSASCQNSGKRRIHGEPSCGKMRKYGAKADVVSGRRWAVL